MWKIVTFKTRLQFDNWVKRHENNCQWVEVFINNGYAVEYRKLRKVY